MWKKCKIYNHVVCCAENITPVSHCGTPLPYRCSRRTRTSLTDDSIEAMVMLQCYKRARIMACIDWDIFFQSTDRGVLLINAMMH